MTEVVSGCCGVSLPPSKCYRTTGFKAVPWKWTSEDWKFGTFGKLLISAKVKNSGDFLLTFRCHKRSSVHKHEPVTKPHTLPLPHQRAAREKNEDDCTSMLQTLLWFIVFYFFFDVVKVVWCPPVLPHWGRGCTKYKLTQVNPKIALIFSPLDFKACPILSAAPPAPVVTLQWSQTEQPGWSSMAKHSPRLRSTAYPLMG